MQLCLAVAIRNTSFVADLYTLEHYSSDFVLRALSLSFASISGKLIVRSDNKGHNDQARSRASGQV